MATIDTAADAVRPELLTASDATIADAVAQADPMILRGLLFLLTGDRDVADMPLKRVRAGRIEITVPGNDGDVQMLRDKAATYLRSYRDSGAGHVPLERERLLESLTLVVGEDIIPAARDLMIEETALDPWARSLKWSQRPDPDRLANFSVAIVGAGMGGLNAAIQLRRAGIQYTIVEKNHGVGGTWHENKYPGARVDTPSRAYTNLFGVDFPYPQTYGDHVENQRYYDWVADEFGVREEIRFGTEISSITWNERDKLWELAASGPDGAETIRANAVITGVGFLSRPNIPDIAGAETFSGESWHTTRWPVGKDISGKRIAVIGTGCTGYQVIPEVARLPGTHLTVFQRTPQWIFPVPGYQAKIPEQVLWLDRNLPFHTNFLRFRQLYGSGPDFVKMFDIDPNFDDPYSCSEVNKAARDRAIEYLEETLPDAAFVDLMTPRHPVWSARPVVVDPADNVLHALQRDNVDLVTDGISEIVSDGIIDGAGRHHSVDIIVYATGFRAHDFLFPMTVTGRDGMTLEQFWAPDGGRAYLGSMVPGFPNLFMLYGPNTNGGLPVSQYHEMSTLFAMKCMERLILDGHETVEPTMDAFWRYNRVVDEGNGMKIWADPRAHNYWWSKHGRTVSQTPFTGYEIREMLLNPDFADMTFG